MAVLSILTLSLSILALMPRGSEGGAVAREPAVPSGTSIMVAAHPIGAGTVIAASDIRSKTVTGQAPDGGFASADLVIGHAAARNLQAGELVRAEDLRVTATEGISARLVAGQRAFSVRVVEDEIVGGFVQSGDRVDVFATIPGSVFAASDAQRSADRSRTVLLLQNVLVLAVGENLETKGAVQSGARTISLSLTPRQLTRVALALRFGKISVAIRRPGDDAADEPAAATLADLIPPEAAAPPASPRHTGIPFYSGTRATFLGGSAGP